MSFQPVNYQKPSAENLEKDVAYALGQAKAFLNLLDQLKLSPESLSILELGPGTNFGAQLIVASFGVRMTLADRFLTRFNQNYHIELYRRIADCWNGPKAQLEAAIKGGHEATSLRLLEEPAEALHSIPDASIDLIYSNAVLEHIKSIELVVQEAARVTKVGGWGRHQIDMRDHRQFDRPLEHLAMEEITFGEHAESVAYEFGNRLRSIEFWAHFESAGFVVRERETNAEADSGYVEDVLPRLRASSSLYRNWPATDLRRICAAMYVQRLSGSEEVLARSRGYDALAIISALKESVKIEFEETSLDPSLCVHDSGHCWLVDLPYLPMGDTDENSIASALCLLEDGVLLNPSHALHANIRSIGGGAFSHWGTQLYFSTSDNTSPVINRRRYSIRVPKR